MTGEHYWMVTFRIYETELKVQVRDEVFLKLRELEEMEIIEIRQYYDFLRE